MTFAAIIKYLTTPKRNLSATAGPTTADDSSKGYGIGSLWVDNTAKRVYFLQDATPAAAVWSIFLDLPGASTDNALAVWNGSNGDAIKNSLTIMTPSTGGLTFAPTAKIVVNEIEGVVPAEGMTLVDRRRYPPSATNPTVPAPVHGDAYYNTLLRMEMRYDGGKSKWLSDQTTTVYFGRQATTAVGSYFRGAGRVTYSATQGIPVTYAGTVVEMGWTRQVSGAGSVIAQAMLNGVAISGALVTGGGSLANDLALDADFGDGITVLVLGVINDPTSIAAQNLMGYLTIKWRVP